MMQRWCWRLRSLAAVHSSPKLHQHHGQTFFPIRPLHTSPNLLHKSPIFTNFVISPYFTSQLNASPIPTRLSYSPLSLIQVRHITAAKQRERKKKNSWKPRTPVTSKVKKIKIKGYSSFKERFRVMKDGQIRRWRAGKRHNAFSKSKKSIRRLRKPGVVHLAYAKVMKKLNFGA
ncbi:hypothetical protein ACS0TY_011773 [Phlomoides rotata]